MARKGMARAIVPPMEERRLGLDFPRGILRNKHARLFPELKALKTLIDELLAKYKTVPVEQIRQREDFRNECLEILRACGGSVWPSGPVPAWLVNAATRTFDQLYPRNLSYLDDQEELEERFLEMMQRKSVSKCRNNNTKNRKQLQREENIGNCEPDVRIRNLDHSNEDDDGEQAGDNDDDDDDNNDDNDDNIVNEQGEEEPVALDIPNESDGDSTFVPSTLDQSTPVFSDRVAQNPRLYANHDARMGRFPQVQQTSMNTGESSSSSHVIHEDTLRQKRKRSQGHNRSRKKGRMSHHSQKHTSRGATAQLPVGNDNQVPVDAPSMQAPAQEFPVPVARMTTSTGLNEHTNNRVTSNIMNASLQAQPNRVARASLSIPIANVSPHDNSNARDDYRDRAVPEERGTSNNPIQNTNTQDHTISPPPVTTPITARPDPTGRPDSVPIIDLTREKENETSVQKRVFLDFFYPNGDIRCHNLGSFRTGLELFKMIAQHGPRETNNKQINLLTFKYRTGKIDDGLINFPYSIPAHWEDMGFERLRYALHDGLDNNVVILNVQVEFAA